MTACFHLPSVVCENCAHLRSNSARPETRTFVTNHLIVAPDSGPTKASSGYVVATLARTDERLDEIKTKWNIPVTLPMSVPWGKDDVVWLVGEVTRLRAEAKRADEEATKLANSDLATTEQIVRALRVENDVLRRDVRDLKAENERLRVARGDYSDPLSKLTPEQRTRVLADEERRAAQSEDAPPTCEFCDKLRCACKLPKEKP